MEDQIFPAPNPYRTIYDRILEDRVQLDEHLGPFKDLTIKEYFQYLDVLNTREEVREELKNLSALIGAKTNLFERMAELAKGFLERS